MTAEELMQMLASRRRPVSELLRDASEIPPEMSKFDSLVFTAEITPAGALAQQVPLIRIPSDYDFSAYGIRGWAQDPATLGTNTARVTFNLRESGRNWDVFNATDQQLASLVGPSGPANDLIFPERTLFRAGAEMQARFTIAAGWSIVGRNVLLGFVLFGQLIAKGVGRRG